MPREHRIAVALAVALAACGGSGSNTPSDPAAPPSSSSGEITAEDELRMAQGTECGRLCPLLTTCAVVEGHANPNISDEERAAFDDERVLAANTERCEDACIESTLSPRQVNVMSQCTDDMPTTGSPTIDQCSGYLACLDAAQARD